MKAIIKITVVIIILCSNFTYAQQIRVSAKHQLEYEQKTLKNTPYIFEGVIVNQEYIRGRLTCNIVKITKIFKGTPQIMLGSIKIMTRLDAGGSKIIIFDGPEGINKGITYIFFSKIATDTSLLPNKIIPTDNSLILTGFEFIEINDLKNHKRFSPQDPAARWVNGSGEHVFKTLEDLYAYLKDNGLTVQEHEEEK